eukprot:5608815-Pyramimonas_sp.AAC.1
MAIAPGICHTTIPTGSVDRRFYDCISNDMISSSICWHDGRMLSSRSVWHYGHQLVLRQVARHQMRNNIVVIVGISAPRQAPRRKCDHTVGLISWVVGCMQYDACKS